MPLFVYPSAEVPAYVLCVDKRPSLKGRGKTAYMDAVRSEARGKIGSPIAAADIAVEVVYSTEHSAAHRVDIDNAVKPTIDALKGIAFHDDAQVRFVSGTLIDRTSEKVISGRVEYVGNILSGPAVVLIAVYSDSRLEELGGAEAVEQQRMSEHLNRPFLSDPSTEP